MTDAPHAKHAAMLQQRVRKNGRKLAAWAAREGYACFRLYDKDIPEIPFSQFNAIYRGKTVSKVNWILIVEK